jgi:nucleoside-diphosphate-sugar epimerase
MGNLYAYGRARMPMTERSPLQPAESKGAVRAELWRKVLDAHDRGELRAVEVHASDYFGPAVGNTSMLGERFFGPLVAGRTVRVVGSPDQPHSWTYAEDIATTLAAAAGYRGDWGRAWHVPCSAPRSLKDIAREVPDSHGAPGKVAPYPAWFFGLLAAVSPELGAVRESSYMFETPFVIDATETERELGVSATPWESALAATVTGYRSGSGR